MDYLVGDLARILNLSSEMIRYYEKMNTLNPVRQEGSNYRIYSAKDILTLIMVMQMQSFQFKIKEIQKMKTFSEKEWTPIFLDNLSRFREELMEELSYKNWLLLRINEVIDRDRFASINVGNSWVKQQFAHYRYPFLRINETEAAKILLPDSVTRFLFSEKVLPFCDFTIELYENSQQWNLVILKEYGDYLKLPSTGQERLPSTLSACTIVKGSQFTLQSCTELRQYVEQNHYKQNGAAEGMLCCGMPAETSKHLVQIQIPILPG